MAAQGLFVRASWSFSNSRFLLNSRLPQLSQISGLKKKAADDNLKNLNLPEKPKKPLTPYFRFYHDRRSQIIKEHPDWRVTQVSVQCGADWKKIDPADKEKYEREYKSEMEKYAEKYLQYTNSLSEEQQEALKNLNKNLRKVKLSRERKKKIRELNRPKKPVGAYMMFVSEQSKLHPGKTYIELMTVLKDKWAQLPEGDKAKYTLPAAKAREKYEEELRQWELEMIKEGKTEFVRKSTLTGDVPKRKSLPHKMSDGEC